MTSSHHWNERRLSTTAKLRRALPHRLPAGCRSSLRTPRYQTEAALISTWLPGAKALLPHRPHGCRLGQDRFWPSAPEVAYHSSQPLCTPFSNSQSQVLVWSWGHQPMEKLQICSKPCHPLVPQGKKNTIPPQAPHWDNTFELYFIPC